jgi:hypothetical protein
MPPTEIKNCLGVLDDHSIVYRIFMVYPKMKQIYFGHYGEIDVTPYQGECRVGENMKQVINSLEKTRNLIDEALKVFKQ